MPGRFRANYHYHHVGVSPIHTPGNIFVLTIQADIVPPTYQTGEEGNEANSIVVVTFSEAVTSSNFVNGVTIKIDGVTASIASAVQQSDPPVIWYTLNSPWANSPSIVTFSYSSITGDYKDLSNNAMQDITTAAVLNDVGVHERYNDAPNSFHLAYI